MSSRVIRNLVVVCASVVVCFGCGSPASGDLTQADQDLNGDPSVRAGVGEYAHLTCESPKVLICHVPPGNPANAHEICVSANAQKAHLKHGDTLGPCEGGNETPDAGVEPEPTPDAGACLLDQLACVQNQDCCSQRCVAYLCTSDACQPMNAACTEEAQCCGELLCRIPVSAWRGVCCVAPGNSCRSAGDCCDGLLCKNGDDVACTENDTDCLCKFNGGT